MKNRKLSNLAFNLPRNTAFLDAILYKDENNNIQKTLHRKPTDQ